MIYGIVGANQLAITTLNTFRRHKKDMRRYKDYASRLSDSKALEKALVEAYQTGKDELEASDYSACFFSLHSANLGFSDDFKTAKARFFKIHSLYEKMIDCEGILEYKTPTTTIRIVRGALHRLPTSNLNKLYKLVCEG